jgi:hypothetical protein
MPNTASTPSFAKNRNWPRIAAMVSLGFILCVLAIFFGVMWRVSDAKKPTRIERDEPVSPGGVRHIPGLPDPDPAKNISAQKKQPAQPEPTYHGKTADEWWVLLKSKDPDQRWRALCALGFLPTQSQETLDEIIKYLDNPQMRHLAVSALVPYGARAKPALPKLLEILGEPHLDLNSGRAANKVIGAIGPDAASAVPLLIRRLRAPRSHRGGEEAVTLCQIGTPEAVRAVIDQVIWGQSPIFLTDRAG